MNKSRSAATGHMGEGEAARKMSVPVANGSVFEEGSVIVTEPFALKMICFLDIWRLGDVSGFHVSHVNSPERIKAAKPTQSAALKLSPSRSRGMRVMIRRKMSSVRGRRRFRLPSPYWRFAPLITRSIRGSLNEELSQPFST